MTIQANQGFGVSVFGAVSGGGGGTPGGLDTQIQFNSSGSFGASANLTFVSPALTIGTQQTTRGQIVFANTAAGAFATTVQSSNSASAAWTLTLPATAGTANYALTTNGSGVSSWSQISLTAGVTGTLPVANGGTNASSASITAFNNITGYTASGATGTTSTNLVFSTSPNITTPTFTTSATGPLFIGGTGTTSTLTLRSTSGVGAAGADIIFQTGNNGATEAMRILNSGRVGVNISPGYTFDVDIGASYSRIYGTGQDVVHRYECAGTGGRTYHVGSTGSSSGAGNGWTIYDITGNASRLVINPDGKVLIGTTAAGASKLTVADDSIQINTAKTPASAAATGTTGQVCWDASYIYVCTATNTWKRAAIATW